MIPEAVAAPCTPNFTEGGHSMRRGFTLIELLVVIAIM
ncbi:MAG: type II secretion system protein [Armatimonadota bacterium]